MNGFFSLVVAAVIAGLASQSWAAEILAQRSLRVGTILAAGDLHAEKESDRTHLEAMIGMEVRKAVFAGREISAYHIGPPTLVRRNEPVVMLYRRGALGLRAEGRALSAGGVGDTIEVMNLDTRITVRAIVTGQRRVEVRR